MIIRGVLFQGVHAARLDQLGRLQGDGPGAGAHVPHHAAGLQVELAQGQRPHLGLRDEAGLRLALGEHVVRVAEAHQPLGRARGVRPVGLALQDHHVQRVERHGLDFAQFAARQPLVLAAEVLADVGLEVVEAADEQLAGDSRRVVGVAGEQADGFGNADAVQHVVERARGQVGEVGFFPRLFHAGEGQLHGGDVRQDLEVVLAEPVAQEAGDAVEQRVAGGDDDDALAAEVGPQLLGEFPEVRADADALALGLGQQPQRGLRPDDHLGGSHQLPGPHGQPGEAVRAKANDVNLVRHNILFKGISRKARKEAKLAKRSKNELLIRHAARIPNPLA